MAIYTSEFFHTKSEGSLRSAKAIVPIVMKAIGPTSVVDIGCGYGIWLSVFQDHGVKDVIGIDGEYIDREALHFPPERFIAHDLTTPFRIPRKFDLAVSLEVAEHLPPHCAREFVASLTGLGAAVLFSAAIPGQGGTHHVHERWQDYWAALFREQGYVAIDSIRWKVWADKAVEPWYAQNTLLYVLPRLLDESGLRSERRPRLEELPVVHPAIYLRSSREELSLRDLAAQVPAAIARGLRRRLSFLAVRLSRRP
jgi:SAM-dependent methyltransferase